VLNAAAWNAVDRAESEPDAAFRANALGPSHLAMAAAEEDAAILHVSTDYVFDGEAGRPYHELDIANPLSVYGKSKLEGEEAVRELNPRHQIVRTAWLYAPRGRNFCHTMLDLGRKGPVRVVDDQRGSPTYAPHLATAISQLVVTKTFGLWHVAGSGEASWYELTRELFRRCGVGAEVTPVTTAEFPRPARRPRLSALVSVRDAPVLPDWMEGVAAFAEALAKAS
jgi:dTDP-4-dehydrorhamnose reductase